MSLQLWSAILCCFLIRTSHTQSNSQPFSPSVTYSPTGQTVSPAGAQWRIQEIIPANYNTQQPPILASGDAVDVKINVAILSFHKISEQDQSLRVDTFIHMLWTDPRLGFPRSVDPRGRLVLGNQMVSHLWHPALNFRNARSTQIFNSISPAVYATLNNRSEVFLALRLSLDLNCDMDFSSYPFDTQHCKIEIGSLSYRMDKLKLWWGNFTLTRNLNLPQFTVVKDGTPQEKCSLKYDIGSFDCIRANFKLVRNIGNFILTKYMPSFMIVCLTFTGFWIPTTAYPARITLCITALLALITQQYQSALNVSYVYALNVWMMMCILFVFGTLAEYSFAVSDWSERFVIVKGKYDVAHSSRNNLDRRGTEERKESLSPHMSEKKMIFHRLLKSNAKNNSVDMFSRIAFPLAYLICIVTYIFIYM